MDYQEKLRIAKEAIIVAVEAQTGEELKAESIAVLYQDTAMEITKMIAVDYSVGLAHGWMYKVTIDVTKAADPATVEIYQKLQ